jgi:hypothetical protein
MRTVDWSALLARALELASHRLGIGTAAQKKKLPPPDQFVEDGDGKTSYSIPGGRDVVNPDSMSVAFL